MNEAAEFKLQLSALSWHLDICSDYSVSTRHVVFVEPSQPFTTDSLRLRILTAVFAYAFNLRDQIQKVLQT
jgi:hypothetical protein